MPIHLDFETYSVANLRTVGAYRYAEDPSTEVLILAWAEGLTGDVHLWLPHTGEPFPTRLAHLVRQGETLVAHNAQFERAIWEAVLAPRHGAPRTRVTQWHCTAARAATAGLPRALDKATRLLGTTARKDPIGQKLIRMFCMPRKPTKRNASTRIRPTDAPAEFTQFCGYCMDDVRAERALDETLPPMTKPELRVLALDFTINERGIPLDLHLVRKAHVIVEHLERAVHAEVMRLTGLRPTQVAKLLEWLQDHGVDLPNMQAETIRQVLSTTVPDAKAERVLLLRMEAGKVSTKKLAAMLRCVQVNGHRVRGTILYHGAHTGRWSGKLVQPHNFVRGSFSPEEQLALIRALRYGDHELISALWEWPMDAISQCMRAFIAATKGSRLLIADYSAIEACVLAWLADDHVMLKAYRARKDVYILMAAALYRVRPEDVTPEQRRIGKNMVLGCGYGLGHVKFVDYCAAAGVTITPEFSKEAVTAYRSTHPEVVSYWSTVQRAFVYATRQRREVTITHGITFGWWNGWTYIRLPSGRRLWYLDVRVSVKDYHGRPSEEITYASDVTPEGILREKLYGGKLVENIDQAIARDLMANGMWNAERGGYPVVSTVHDEVLAERTVGEGSLEEYIGLLCRLPRWAEGCPVTAKGFEAQHYRKD